MNAIIATRSDQQKFKTENPETLMHLSQNLKVKMNSMYRILVIGEGLYMAKLIYFDVKTQAVFDWAHDCPKLSPWFDLLIGVSRPQTTKRILERSATLGVRKIIFYPTELTEKSYLTSKTLETGEIDKYLNLGLSQSAIYYKKPQVEIKSYLPQIEGQLKLMMDPFSKRTFKDQDYANSDPNEIITLALGPERGYGPRDLEQLRAQKFVSIKISSSILRVEEAMTVAVGQLELMKL